jgi:hypothetical protein
MDEEVRRRRKDNRKLKKEDGKKVKSEETKAKGVVGGESGRLLGKRMWELW